MQNHKKSPNSARRHADCGRSDSAQSSAQARHSLARGRKITKKPNFRAAARRLWSLSLGSVQAHGLPIRSNGLQQLVVCYFTLPIRSNGLQQLWVTRFSLLDFFFSLVECQQFRYLLSLTTILVLL
jgi:hypothetical protein